MAIDVIKWVLAHSAAEHSARLVAISLAEHAHPDGTESYPSIGTIARETRLGESTVRLALERLKDLGEIVETGVSRRRTRCFLFPMDPAGSAGPQDLRGERDHEGRLTPQDLATDPAGSADEGADPAPEPSLEPSGEPSSSSFAVEGTDRERAGVAERDDQLSSVAAFEAARPPLPSDQQLPPSEARLIAATLGFTGQAFGVATFAACKYGNDVDAIRGWTAAHALDDNRVRAAA